MSKQLKAVLDSGPFIHLKEINALDALKIFELNSPVAVFEETRGLEGIDCQSICVKNKSIVEMLSTQFELGLGESEAIALCKQCGIELLLTDDLDARIVAKKFGLKAHGSVGILLKAFKEKIFSKSKAIELAGKLKTNSSLFITNELIEYAIQEIKKSK